MLNRVAIVLCVFATTACTDEGYVNGRQGGKSLEKELCLTGCRDDVHRALSSDEEFDEVDDGMYVTTGAPGKIQLDVCDVLPKDGVCSLACDDRALASLTAPGTCIDFACALNDGRDLVFKRCMPDAQITN